METIDIEIT